jgi:hypothetical protein
MIEYKDMLYEAINRIEDAQSEIEDVYNISEIEDVYNISEIEDVYNIIEELIDRLED